MWAWVLAACASAPTDPSAGSVQWIWRMEEHATDAVAALEAVRRRDLAGVRSAGEGIARPDPAPGLPDAGAGPLGRVREGGRAVAEATDLAGAARALGDTTEACAACHLALGVAPGDSADPLWTAVLFEADDRWEAGASALGDGPALAAGRSWDTRREVVFRLIGDGKL